MRIAPSNCFSHRLLFILLPLAFCGVLAISSTISLANSSTSNQATRDYSVCKTCDVTDKSDPEVQHFATVIAEARWSMQQNEAGVLIMRDQEGKEFAFRWTSTEGSLKSLEPLESETAQD